MRAVEVAIAQGDLPPEARRYGKTTLLEAMADAIGLARNALKNLYYRDEVKLEIVLQGYIVQHPLEVSRTLKELQFRQFSPRVWKRPAEQLKASADALNSTVILLQSAEQLIRESPDAPIELRREVGTVAAEVMACALTFYDGRQRWEMLQEGERIFLSAMSPLSLSLDVDPDDASLFAKFWENRATLPGLQWSNIWDDPSLAPTIGEDILRPALGELDRAADWTDRHPGTGSPHAAERRRQLLADKAKWLAKAGRFEDAHIHLARLGDFDSAAASADELLIRTLEAIVGGRLEAAARTGGQLAELIDEHEDEGGLARVTSRILLHNIDLLRGRTPPLPEEIAAFLRDSPVVASEMVHLPRYKERIKALGYGVAARAN